MLQSRHVTLICKGEAYRLDLDGNTLLLVKLKPWCWIRKRRTQGWSCYSCMPCMFSSKVLAPCVWKVPHWYILYLTPSCSYASRF